METPFLKKQVTPNGKLPGNKQMATPVPRKAMARLLNWAGVGRVGRWGGMAKLTDCSFRAELVIKSHHKKDFQNVRSKNIAILLHPQKPP